MHVPTTHFSSTVVPDAVDPASVAGRVPTISLVICTRNRASRLGACLQKVAELRYDQPWEFIVVDNGSTDNTAAVIAQFTMISGLSVQYVHQPVKGLSNARNAGLARVRAPIVAFTDDDCYVAPDFLLAVARAFEDEKLGYAGGRVLLHDPTDYPATISLSTEPEVLLAGKYVVPGVVKGANMTFRREVLEQIGGFDPWFGSGASFPAEDCDAVSRASLAGWAGRYEPSIVVSHHHGRKADTIGTLYRDYDIGRGAYHAKLLLSSGAPWQAVRGGIRMLRRSPKRPVGAYWETYGALWYAWTWLRARVTGKR